MDGKDTSPGLPADSGTEVEWTEAPGLLLEAEGVAPLEAPVGFGAATTGGAGGEVVEVFKVKDDPDDPAPHSLRWAVNRPGPTWIVFTENLHVDLRAPLDLTADTTIDGRGHRVRISGHTDCGGLRIHDTENVVIESLILTGFGDPALAESNDPHDAISVKRSRRVWITHNDLSLASDKLVGISDGTSEATVSGNWLHDQHTVLQIGNMTTANEDLETAVSVTRNHFDHCGYRQPVVSYGKAHAWNNYLDTWDTYAVRSQRIAQVHLEANVFRPGDDPTATLIHPGNDGANDAGSLEDDRDGYLYETGNLYVTKCKVQDTGPDHVFDPAKAYAYTAEVATEELAARIAEEAGPR